MGVAVRATLFLSAHDGGNLMNNRGIRNFVVLLSLLLLLALLTSAVGARKGEETAGNNLSFPVIWAEGVQKTLPGTAGMSPILTGNWWYWWGTDAEGNPLSCEPNPANTDLCLDNSIPGEGWVRAYLQKDGGNIWQADSTDWSDRPVNVNRIDWGDNLESVDWYTRSKVRTEVVLFQDLPEILQEYQMRHVSGWGIDEVHGLAVTPEGAVLEGPGLEATIYSNCARLIIQKLYVPRTDPRLADLVWVPGEGWDEPEGYPSNLINSALFNSAVHEGMDGPGYYSAEINVKGRIIYGYTWNVRRLNEGAGDYRITFSLDAVCGSVGQNTFFTEETEIIVPLETETLAEGGDSGGGTAVLVPENDLTYIDIRILSRGGGGSRAIISGTR